MAKTALGVLVPKDEFNFSGYYILNESKKPFRRLFSDEEVKEWENLVYELCCEVADHYQGKVLV